MPNLIAMHPVLCTSILLRAGGVAARYPRSLCAATCRPASGMQATTKQLAKRSVSRMLHPLRAGGIAAGYPWSPRATHESPDIRYAGIQHSTPRHHQQPTGTNDDHDDVDTDMFVQLLTMGRIATVRCGTMVTMLALAPSPSAESSTSSVHHVLGVSAVAGGALLEGRGVSPFVSYCI